MLVVPLVECVIAEEQEGRALGAAPASDQLAPVSDQTSLACYAFTLHITASV